MAIHTKHEEHAAGGKQKTVVSCNFRSAGRISNELARALTTLHESFARNAATSLDGFLGTGVEVKLSGLDQLRFAEYIAGVAPFSCIVPFSTDAPSGAIFVECGADLVFPIIDLLLGGEGSPAGGMRDLSEIEEEIMQDVFSAIVRQAEGVWRLPAGALMPGKRVKPAAADQLGLPEEKVTCIKFMLELGGIAGSFQLVLSSAILNLLLQQIKMEQPRRRTTVCYFPQAGIRDRILDSDVEVAVELPGLKIAVKDLLSLLPGSVLKLRAPVRTPGMLVAGGRSIFEATPVRNGSRKAAQLGRRIASPSLNEV